MRQTLLQQYVAITSTNDLYGRNRSQWEYQLFSYLGGLEYRTAGMLTRYVNETEAEYQARCNSTHLENHCKSVVSTYISFLFRQDPVRDFGSLTNSPLLESFLKDSDLDGRSFDNFMKEVSVWNSVFGHSWIMVVKPNVGAATRAEEISQGARPYLTLLTPLTVMDWTWTRDSVGRFSLSYLKYAEEANDSLSVIKEWTQDTITTWQVDHKRKTARTESVEVNQLGQIPAVLSYNHRSPVRGIGISDISDIADAQRFIYNLTSEVEQSVRINGHPALVKTASTEAAAGAGAIVQIDENLDPGLKPYMLTVSTDINSIYNGIDHSTNAIDTMANVGSMRSNSPRTLSGVAREQEFALLNAKLSEKADNLELTEEHIWRWFCLYQGLEWTGVIDYPGSFNIRDTDSEISRLKIARETATDPRVLREIDKQIVDWMGLDPEEILPEQLEVVESGRTYENGEPIDPRLPEAYRNATGESSQCANCSAYNPETFTCSTFGGAPVRPMWVCARWIPIEPV